jgi:hypothetical protein
MKTQCTQLFLVGILLLSTAAKAQTTDWFEGKLTLRTNQTMHGLICYNWDGEIVQLRLPDGRIRAYSPEQVNTFSIRGYEKAVRLFSSLPLNRSATKKKHNQLHRQVFMEEYLVGYLPVFRRLQNKGGLFGFRPKKPLNMANGRDLMTNYDHFDYFVYDGNNFQRLLYYYRDVEPLMADHQQEISEYARIYNLNLRETGAQLMVLARYNQLKAKEIQENTGPSATVSAQ